MMNAGVSWPCGARPAKTAAAWASARRSASSALIISAVGDECPDRAFCIVLSAGDPANIVLAHEAELFALVLAAEGDGAVGNAAFGHDARDVHERGLVAFAWDDLVEAGPANGCVGVGDEGEDNVVPELVEVQCLVNG